MKISAEKLTAEAEATGFRPDVLEKAARRLDRGKIAPALLTSDTTLQKRIQDHPLLKWKAINVRRHRGLL